MANVIEEKRFGELVLLLNELEAMHLELVDLIRSRTSAMKKNDVVAMRELGERERALAARIQEREGLRRQLVALIGKQEGWSARMARAFSISQLAARVAEPQRSTLIEVASRLRNAVVRVAKANRVAGEFAQAILEHLRWVFAAVRPEGERQLGYSGDGLVTAGGGRAIFDTVG
ncbi:MAG: flagellar export chaperone FlgN [Phycisphaerales bacterium]|nr:MAG: flagellar export chaperone FlgN [Phycisphaerales bacterium]